MYSVIGWVTVQTVHVTGYGLLFMQYSTGQVIVHVVVRTGRVTVHATVQDGLFFMQWYIHCSVVLV